MLGTVTIDDRTVTCLITDFSSSGARLRLSQDVALPKTFWLDAPRHWKSYRVTCCWRDGEEVGVRFI
jgi:hypothetical protein